ncbi:MAG: TIGR03960 family B12-binding radical SAM protein [Clostridia bacterium]|nr:TIGR03960 family B12-binding radical SAM protein [Clostridia bacterium]
MYKKVEPFLKNVLKPGRYIGGETGQIIKEKNKVDVRFAFCFPDTYEIGMSNLGMKILYGVLNNMENVWCERCFAPWEDMGKVMRENNIPLYALESGDALSEFDIVGFTVQYEMCYTNILYMLELGGIPLYSHQRNDSHPIVIAGGPCTYNSEPFADFIDIISIGEGEEALPELVNLYNQCKKNGVSRADFLRKAAQLDGFYVPSLYKINYNDDGTIESVVPEDGVPEKITKRIITDFDNSFFPENPVVPLIEAVHDRVILEVFRGCTHGCRFCQAGMIYRPVRERSAEVLNRQAKNSIDNTGYDEISLTSLSISDYTCLEKLTDYLLEWTEDKKINLSLPSMRLDSFTKELMKKVMSIRKSGLTFAPEAGTQALRDRINKGITEEDLMRSVKMAFDTGRDQVKLYFMLGLPTETYDDLEGIAQLAEKVVEEFYHNPRRPKGKHVKVNVSVSCFVPKPFTPFQRAGQDTLEQLREKQEFLRGRIKSRRIEFSYHEAKVSRIEAVLARGDRRLSEVIYNVYKSGQIFSAWDEYFSSDVWEKAVSDAGLSIEHYANRNFGQDEILPWSMIDIGVTDEFLKCEYRNAIEGKVTPPCNKKCSACGMMEHCGYAKG